MTVRWFLSQICPLIQLPKKLPILYCQLFCHYPDLCRHILSGGFVVHTDASVEWFGPGLSLENGTGTPHYFPGWQVTAQCEKKTCQSRKWPQQLGGSFYPISLVLMALASPLSLSMLLGGRFSLPAHLVAPPPGAFVTWYVTQRWEFSQNEVPPEILGPTESISYWAPQTTPIQ